MTLPSLHTKRLTARASTDQGQSLIETALILPLLLLLAFDAINFGYFFYTAVNVASAPREGVEWSIIGPETPSDAANWPLAGPTTDSSTVSFLTYEDMRGSLLSSTKASVQVCSVSLGVNGAGNSQKSNCTQYIGGPPIPAAALNNPAADPEGPLFVLNRVDVVYQVTPIIPQFTIPTPGGVINLSILPNLKIHRQVSMRGM